MLLGVEVLQPPRQPAQVRPGHDEGRRYEGCRRRRGRGDEIEHVVRRILCRRTKNCAALVGAMVVGKTTIAERLVQRIAAGKVPPQLAGVRLVELDLAAIVAGTHWRTAGILLPSDGNRANHKHQRPSTVFCSTSEDLVPDRAMAVVSFWLSVRRGFVARRIEPRLRVAAYAIDFGGLVRDESVLEKRIRKVFGPLVFVIT